MKTTVHAEKATESNLLNFAAAPEEEEAPRGGARGGKRGGRDRGDRGDRPNQGQRRQGNKNNKQTLKKTDEDYPTL